jgi:2-polyprenyl-3-methyl-5-hydroxy-6-metoxy-1,4-benzoquinol methylase
MLPIMSKINAKLAWQKKEQPHYAGIAELWAIESQLKNYNKDIALKISRDFKSGDDVLEFGGGIGSIAEIIQANKKITPDCVELDPELRLILKERGFDSCASVEQLNKRYDHVYLSNVLEHIEDDVNVLKQIHSVLKEDGRVIIYSPAFQVLYTSFDAQVGHYRRYSPGDIQRKLMQANYTILRYEYVDSLGFLAWMLLKINAIFKVSKTDSGAVKSHNSFAIYDKFVYPISRIMDKLGFRYFLGKNILVVAKKIN